MEFSFLPKYEWEVTHWGTDDFSGAGYTTEETTHTKQLVPQGGLEPRKSLPSMIGCWLVQSGVLFPSHGFPTVS